MADWKKVIVSGSDAALKSIGLGTADPTSTAGEISASGKVYATTSEQTGQATYNVVIKNATTGEFMHTSSNAISPTLDALTIGTGLTASVASPNGQSYDGTYDVTLAFDEASVAGNGLKTNSTAGELQIELQSNSNLSLGTAGLGVDSGSLVDTAKGLAPGNGTHNIGMNVGTGLGFTLNDPSLGTGVLTASFQAGSALSAGNGVTIVDAAAPNTGTTYTGADARVIKVDSASLAGEGLAAGNGTNDIQLKNVANLSSNTVLKWDDTNNQLVNSTITQTGTDIIIGTSSETITVKGDLIVEGDATFQDADTLRIADDFITLASGSGTGTAFGIIGQQGTGNTDGVGWIYNTSGEWIQTTDANPLGAGTQGTAVGRAGLNVDSTRASSTLDQQKDGNIIIEGGDIYIYTA